MTVTVDVCVVRRKRVACQPQSDRWFTTVAYGGDRSCCAHAFNGDSGGLGLHAKRFEENESFIGPASRGRRNDRTLRTRELTTTLASAADVRVAAAAVLVAATAVVVAAGDEAATDEAAPERKPERLVCERGLATSDRLASIGSNCGVDLCCCSVVHNEILSYGQRELAGFVLLKLNELT